MKLQKQEALQLLKKKEKTDNIIKVHSEFILPTGVDYWLPTFPKWHTITLYVQKNKEKRQKKKQQEIDPNRPKKPASSFLLFR